MVVSVGAHQIGQQFRVTGVGFRTREVVAVSVACGGERVDRVDGVSGCEQSRYPHASVGFDAYDDVGRFACMGGHHIVKPADAR